jgi:hypothetical protein
MKKQIASLIVVLSLMLSVSVRDVRSNSNQTPDVYTTFVNENWQTIVQSIEWVCRTGVVFRAMWPSLTGPFEGAIPKALEALGPGVRQAAADFLRQQAAKFAAGKGLYTYGGKAGLTLKELLAKLAGDASIWRTFRPAASGVAKLGPAAGAKGAVLIELLLVVVVAMIAATAGYVTGKVMVRENKIREYLEVKAADDEAFGNLLLMLARALRSGRLRLLPGLTAQKAIARIQENLEVGRAPYLNVLEPRPCPKIEGTWAGMLFVKEVIGSSNIQVGSSRRATFTLSQGGCDVTLRFANNEISGNFMPGETLPSQIAGRTERMERDEVVLIDNPTGALTRARLLVYGLGSGSLRGQMDVEIEQRAPNGAKIVSGGRMSRSGATP